MKWLILTVALLSSSRAAFAGTRPAESPGDYTVVCRDAGAGGYEAFPDVCRLDDGRLMVVFYAGNRHVTGVDAVLPHGGRICYVTSSDDGATWSEARTLYDGPYDDRDPSITQLPNGRLACTFFCYPGRGSYVIYSSDAGATWSEPIRMGMLYNVSSPLRVLSSGRYIVGLYSENEQTDYASGAAVFSDDSGKSWPHLVNLDNAGQFLDAETDIIELRDGILYAIHRGGKGATMHWTTSSDRGLNWGRTKALDFVGHSPYLHRATGDIVILSYRGMLDDQWRTEMRYSVDECRTWSEPILIDTVTGAYPSMANLADGSVLVTYYEEGEGSDIRARRFRIDRLGVQWLPPAAATDASFSRQP